jgi:hypothetical protein
MASSSENFVTFGPKFVQNNKFQMNFGFIVFTFDNIVFVVYIFASYTSLCPICFSAFHNFVDQA